MKKKWVPALLGLLLIAAAAVCLLCIFGNVSEADEKETADPQTSAMQSTASESELPLDELQSETRIEIDGFTPQDGFAPVTDRGLRIVSVGSYSGSYMEDGSDEPVEHVAAMLVQNIGAETAEYAEVSAQKSGGETVRFVLTGLPANAYVLVLEAERSAYAALSAPQVTEYAAAMDVTRDYAGDFEIYLGDGVINVRNCSARDYADDIFVYYKTYRDGVFWGGITYRARFGGLMAQTIGQSIQSHATADETVVVYMAYGE